MGTQTAQMPQESDTLPLEKIKNSSIPWEKIKSFSVSQSGFVFDQHNGHSFSVNETGLVILNALLEGKDLATIKQILLLNYEVLPETVDAGLNHFISQLNRHL